MSKTNVSIPLWLEHSGLPESLREELKSPLGWFLFKQLVQLDCESNLIPGVVECSVNEISAVTGIDGKTVVSLLKKLRKLAFIRCFLPDHEDEPALIQIVTPLRTPVDWTKLQQEHPKFQGQTEQVFRYATTTSGEQFASEELKQTKFQQVLELYLNLVSMKLNQFVQDEIALIAEVYDYKLVQKVFLQARQKEIQNLGWIIRQIREETLQKKRLREAEEAEKAKAASATEPSNSPSQSDSGW